METHSSILVWKSHGHRSLVGYSQRGCKRVGYNLVTKQQLLELMHNTQKKLMHKYSFEVVPR